MPTRADIELAKAVLVLVTACHNAIITDSKAYLHVELEAIQALADSEPDENDEPD